MSPSSPGGTSDILGRLLAHKLGEQMGQQSIIARLHQEILRALRAPDFRDRLVAEGADVVGSTPDELASHMKSESEKWARVIKAASIKPE